MKKRIVWILVLLAAMFVVIFLGVDKKNSAEKILYPVQINDKWGYIDNKGKMIIEPIYERADEFSNGAAIVQIKDKNGSNTEEGENSVKYGAINTSGKVIVQPEYAYISNFKEGVAGAVFEDKDTYSFTNCLLNKTGKILATLPDELEIYSLLHYGNMIDIQSEGMILVRNSYTEMFGFMNSKGEMIIPCRYYEGYNFSEGLALVKEGTSYKYIDKTGKVIIDAGKYSYCRNFAEGLAAVAVQANEQSGAKYGYIDKKGNLKIEPQFAQAYEFSEGLAKVCMGEGINLYSIGYIDETGIYRIGPDLEDTIDETLFSENLVPLNDGAGGYLNKEGKLVIAPVVEKGEDNYLKHNMAGAFRNGIARVSLSDGRTGYIDTKGSYIWEPSN